MNTEATLQIALLFIAPAYFIAVDASVNSNSKRYLLNQNIIIGQMSSHPAQETVHIAWCVCSP